MFQRSIHRAINFVKRNRTVAVAGLALGATSMSFATGPDFSSLTSAVDFTTVGAAILAVYGLKSIPAVYSVGAKMVMRAIGR